MKMKNLLFVCASVMVLLIGCTRAPVVDTKAEANAIRNLENQWSAAFLAKDLDKGMSFYSSDAISMPQGKPIIKGKEAIKERVEKMLADTTYLFETYSATLETVEVSASGDLAYVMGIDKISKKTAGGVVDEKSKWIDIWKKVNGEWKCAVSIGNDGN